MADRTRTFRVNWAELTPPQRAALLRPLIEIDGLAYRQAADQLGTTKNSIVGVASRLKLKAMHPPHGTSAPRGPRKARVGSTILKVRQSRAGHGNRLPVPGYPDGEVADPTPIEDAIWLPLPGMIPIALENHRDSQCRWPVGHALYCGAPVRPGEHQVYCEAHHRIGVKVLPSKVERKPK